MDGHREMEPVPVLSEMQVLDLTLGALDGSSSVLERNKLDILVFRMGENIAEPADGPDQPRNESNGGNDQAGDEAGKNQAEAEGGDNRPASRLGKFDFVGIFGHVRSGC